QGRVEFHQGDAEQLPFAENTFDAAFLCWFLEHVSSPLPVLKEVGRVLSPGAQVHCNEVMNVAFFLDPYSHAIQKYWFEFNDQQWNMKGDPFIGGKLGNLLTAAGFQNVSTELAYCHFDNRTPKLRAQYIDECRNHLL